MQAHPRRYNQSSRDLGVIAENRQMFVQARSELHRLAVAVACVFAAVTGEVIPLIRSVKGPRAALFAR